MPFANGIDITGLIERIPAAGDAAKPITANQQVKDLSNMIKALTRFEAKVEADQKATVTIKINGQTFKLSFDPSKDSPVEAVTFTVAGMEFSPSDVDPQALVAMAREGLRSAAPEGQAQQLVDALLGAVDNVAGIVGGISPANTIGGLAGGLGLDILPTTISNAVGGLAGDPLGVLTSTIGNLSGNPLGGGNPASPVLNPATGPALGAVGQTSGSQGAPALDAFNDVNSSPLDFLFRVGSNTSTFNTGSDMTTPLRQPVQDAAAMGPAGTLGTAVGTATGLANPAMLPGVPALPAAPGIPSLPGLPAAPDLGAVTGIVGSLPIMGLFGMFG